MTGSTWRRRTVALASLAAGALAIMAGPAWGASTVTYNPSNFGSSFNITGEANDD